MQPGTKTPCVFKRVGRRLDPSWQAELCRHWVILPSWALPIPIQFQPFCSTGRAQSKYLLTLWRNQQNKLFPLTRPSVPVGVKGLAVNLSSHPRLKEDSARLQDSTTVGWECESFTGLTGFEACNLHLNCWTSYPTWLAPLILDSSFFPEWSCH